MAENKIRVFLDFCDRIEEALKYCKNEEQLLVLQGIVDEICGYDEPSITFNIAERYTSSLSTEMVVQLYKSVLENKKLQNARRTDSCEEGCCMNQSDEEK